MRRTGALFGRDAERAQLARLIDEGARLITVLGPAGIGKTRLALEVAAGRPSVLAVDLDPIRDVDDLVPVVARAAGLQVSSEGGVQGLLRALARRPRAVVLLDNAEHAIEAVAAFALALLEAPSAPPLLVTSQVRLHLAEEVCFELAPVDSEAGRRIFLQTAARVAPGHSPDSALVDRIVRAVDHHPLAIELAASRLRYRSLEDLAAPDGLPIEALFRGDTSLPPRSRSLKAALQSAWSLLTPAHQAAALSLAVFEGGFVLDDGVAVLRAAGAESPEALLDTLRDVSLSWARTWQGQPRQGLFDVVRRFVLETYAADPALEAARAHHAARFEAGARGAHEDFWGSRPDHARQWLAREQANLRAAEAFLQAHDPRRAAQLVIWMAPGLAYSGPKRANRSWLSRGLRAAQRAEDRRLEGWLQLERGTSFVVRGEYEAALQVLGAARACLTTGAAQTSGRTAQSLDGQARLLIAHVHLRSGRAERAERLLNEVEAELEGEGDDELRAHAELQRLVFLVERTPDRAFEEVARVRAWAQQRGRARLEGMTWMFEGQASLRTRAWQAALPALDQAVHAYRSISEPIYVGVSQADRARALLEMGLVNQALAQTEQALDEASAFGDDASAAFLHLVHAEVLVRIQRTDAAQLALRRARAAAESVEVPALCARIEALAESLGAARPRPALVHIDGRRFEIEARAVDLTRRRAVRRILGRLALAASQGQAPLRWTDLFAAGWPGAELDDGARQRTYTAVWTLRNLGLGPHLETDGDGYRLAHVEVLAGDGAARLSAPHT